MRPIRPKYENMVDLQIQITNRAKEVLNQYTSYTKYTEEEIIEKLISEIPLDDKDFVKWLEKKRNNKKVKAMILSDLEEDVVKFEIKEIKKNR